MAVPGGPIPIDRARRFPREEPARVRIERFDGGFPFTERYFWRLEGVPRGSSGLAITQRSAQRQAKRALKRIRKRDKQREDSITVEL